MLRPSPLPDGTTVALRAWIEQQRRSSQPLLRDGAAAEHAAEIREMMRHLCAEARARGVGVEQIIVLLKQLWNTSPTERGPDGQPGADRVGRDAFDAIVSLCIKEFYGRAPSDGDGAA